MLILSNVYTLYRYMFFKLKTKWYNLIYMAKNFYQLLF